MSSNMNIVDLVKSYGAKTVVDEVSFEVPKGKVLSLIGPNGAGKSTVMGMISRLIAKDTGVIDFEGQDLSKWKSKELAKHLSILTQHNNIQMKLTVRELVAFGRFPYSGSRLTPEDNAVVDKAISYMELENLRTDTSTNYRVVSGKERTSQWLSRRTRTTFCSMSRQTTLIFITHPI